MYNNVILLNYYNVETMTNEGLYFHRLHIGINIYHDYAWWTKRGTLGLYLMAGNLAVL